MIERWVFFRIYIYDLIYFMFFEINFEIRSDWLFFVRDFLCINICMFVGLFFNFYFIFMILRCLIIKKLCLL